MRVSQQIGWSQESKLIYQIVKQTERLNQLLPGNQPAANTTRVSRQIGWSNESNLYYEWLRSLDKLTQHYSNCCTPTTSNWNITDIYGPPSNGLFNIPNVCISESLLDPNQAGQINPGASCVPAENYNQLYISLYDSNGVYSNELASMVGNSGTLTFTQGSNSVTYSFTAGSFILNANGFDVVAFDTTLSSVPGSLVVTSPATGNFNMVDPITITIV
jgi:hypothetical protein